MRTYAVGDIHGRHDLLMTALNEAVIHSDGAESRFICTGDMIDRGPAARQVLWEFRNGRYANLHLIALQGNHESMMCEVIGRNPMLYHQWDWWQGNGGWATVQSYGIDKLVAGMPALNQQILDDRAWLECLPFYFIDDPHRIYVHGGMRLISRHDGYLPLAKQPREYCQWARSDKVTDHGPFEGRHVVHGHEQWEDGPILLPNRTNLDTYAWRTGKLAIGVFDDDVPGGPIEILWAEGEPWQK